MGVISRQECAGKARSRRLQGQGPAPPEEKIEEGGARLRKSNI